MKSEEAKPPSSFYQKRDGGGDSGDGEVSDSRDVLKSAGLGEGFYMVTEDKGDIKGVFSGSCLCKWV